MEILTKKGAEILFRHHGYLQELNTTEVKEGGKLTFRKPKTRIPVTKVNYDVKTDNYQVTLESDESVWYISSRAVTLENLIPYNPLPKYRFVPDFLHNLNAALVADGKDEAQIADVSELSGLEKTVKELLEVELNPNQFTALVSFAYEHGLDNLSKSSLLRKINAGHFLPASREFGRWAKREGKIVRSKAILRQQERKLFLTEVEE